MCLFIMFKGIFTCMNVCVCVFECMYVHCVHVDTREKFMKVIFLCRILLYAYDCFAMMKFFFIYLAMFLLKSIQLIIMQSCKLSYSYDIHNTSFL